MKNGTWVLSSGNSLSPRLAEVRGPLLAGCVMGEVLPEVKVDTGSAKGLKSWIKSCAKAEAEGILLAVFTDARHLLFLSTPLR